VLPRGPRRARIVDTWRDGSSAALRFSWGLGCPSSLADGTYILETTADPDNVLEEVNNRNNCIAIHVRGCTALRPALPRPRSWVPDRAARNDHTARIVTAARLP
jgi:hypothetical protein